MHFSWSILRVYGEEEEEEEEEEEVGELGELGDGTREGIPQTNSIKMGSVTASVTHHVWSKKPSETDMFEAAAGVGQATRAMAVGDAKVVATGGGSEAAGGVTLLASVTAARKVGLRCHILP